MSGVAVSGLPGVKGKERVAILLGECGNEAAVLRIETIVPPVKGGSRRVLGLEKFPKIRNRSVVQIWRTQPDSVQGRVGIARLLAKVSEALRIGRSEAPVLLIAGIESALVHGQDPGIGVEAPAVRADFLDGNDGAYQLIRQRRFM